MQTSSDRQPNDTPSPDGSAGQSRQSEALVRLCETLPHDLTTPCYVVDESAIIANLEILSQVQRRGNCRILLALKAFGMFSLFDTVRQYLPGVCASGVNEAKLGHEFFHTPNADGVCGEVHVGAPAFSDDDMTVLANICDHVVFNSFTQFTRHLPKIQTAQNSGRKISCGLRLNPGYSEVTTEIYDPCGKYSRLGITATAFRKFSASNYPALPEAIEGLHFHSLCEQGFDALNNTWRHIEKQFGDILKRAADDGRLKWLNLGGGHHITKSGYDIDSLCELTREITEKYQVQVYLEPGEAIAINTGILATTVLDVMENEMQIAILDASAAAHMPDVLEMPYRPDIYQAGEPGQPGKKAHTYRLTGPTCLAGDIIGDYSFDQPLEPGDRIILMDMSHYTMVKNNTFNGINLPNIAVVKKGEQRPTLIKKFGYEDFRNRLS